MDIERVLPLLIEGAGDELQRPISAGALGGALPTPNSAGRTGGRTAFLSGINCPTSPRAQAAEEGNQHVNVGIRCPSPLPAPARLVARARFDGEKRVSNRASGEPAPISRPSSSPACWRE